MTSIRYIILSLLYILGNYFIVAHSSDDNKSIIHMPTVVLFITTFLFMYYIKYSDNKKCMEQKLPDKYIFSQSIFYSIIALLSHYLYEYIMEKECIKTVDDIIHGLSNMTYIPEGLFVAGIVLLSNRIGYLIYPKCEN